MLVFTYDTFHDVLCTEPDLQGLNAAVPPSVCLSVNNRCVFKCVRCLPDHTPGGCADFDVSPIVNALDASASLRLVWGGGEPTLSPRLQEYLAFSMARGWYNVVVTGMTQGDPLADLAGNFFYDVVIYGTTAKEFADHTGWDLFSTFERKFQDLFRCGHAVCATIRLHAGWRDYLENRVRWLNAYPLRRLQLIPFQNDNMKRILSRADQGEIKTIVETIAPGYPVVLAASASDIRIEAVPGSSAFARLNGVLMENQSVFRSTLKQLIPQHVNALNAHHTYRPT